MQAGKSYSPVEKDCSYKFGMADDAVRDFLKKWDAEPGNHLSELSRAVGRSHSYFQQFLKRGIPRQLPEVVRERAAPLLGVSADFLRGNTAERPKPHGRPSLPARNATLAGPVTLKGTIPVFGQAVGGKDGRFVFNGSKVADVVAPASLSSVPNAYAVYVVGDSMDTRYLPGELVYVNPNIPVRQNDFVVVQILGEHEDDPPDAYVKRFVSMDDKKLRLVQLKPKKTLEFPRSKVVSVHRIIMGGDG